MSTMVSEEMMARVRECLATSLEKGEFRRVAQLGDLYVSLVESGSGVPSEFRYLYALRIDGVRYWFYSRISAGAGTKEE